MKKAFAAAIVLLLVVTALIARANSTGKKLIDTGRGYTEHLAAGETVEAYGFLSDSLSSLLTPDFLDCLDNAPSTGSFRTGRNEDRGLTLSISLAEGGSRTLWLREEPDGTWKIVGDSSLDNLFGNATVLCSSYAKETVIPALAEGRAPGEFVCPVSGTPYYLEGDRLFCSAGHLDNGLNRGGSACRTLRDSLAAMIFEYISTGYGYPSGFGEMYENSNGSFGQRGGFRCPDDGYSYYEITSEGVYCPFHRETSLIENPGVAESADSTSS